MVGHIINSVRLVKMIGIVKVPNTVQEVQKEIGHRNCVFLVSMDLSKSTTSIEYIYSMAF